MAEARTSTNGGEVEVTTAVAAAADTSARPTLLLLTRNVNGGTYGTYERSAMVNFTANGATSGGAGTIVNNQPIPYTTPTALPIELKSFDAKSEKRRKRHAELGHGFGDQQRLLHHGTQRRWYALLRHQQTTRSRQFHHRTLLQFYRYGTG